MAYGALEDEVLLLRRDWDCSRVSKRRERKIENKKWKRESREHTSEWDPVERRDIKVGCTQRA